MQDYFSIIDVLNIISALLGIIGSIMIYKFGIPNHIDTGGKIGFALLRIDEEEKRIIVKYKCLGKIGILLIILSFVFQLLANPSILKLLFFLFHLPK